MTADITIERCDISDLEYVDFVMRHPSIYPHISDDLSPKAEAFSAGALLASPQIIFLKPFIEGFGAGVFLMHPWNSVTYEVHSCVLPGFRGKLAVTASRLAASWMFRNTGCRKITTQIPARNRAAYALAHRAGFRTEGVNKKSFLKNGVLYDQALMGLSKD